METYSEGGVDPGRLIATILATVGTDKAPIQRDVLDQRGNPRAKSRAIRHDILDFCVRELVTLGGGGANIRIRLLHPGRTSPSLLMGRSRVNASRSNICEGQSLMRN